MPVRNVLGMLDRHDFTDLSGVDDLLDCLIERRITQHMTDLEQLPAALARPRQLFAIGFAERHRLLEQHVVAAFQSAPSGLDMLIVRGRDQRKICDTRSIEQIAGVLEARSLGEPESVGKGRATTRITFRNPDDRTEFRTFQQQRQ